MLTRIEIDGFKSFRSFALDVPPFLVVLGRNAAGKSNLFDALRFLRLMADRPLREAAQGIRGELAELFHRHVDGTRMSRMSFAVEVLLDRAVTDAFGDTAQVGHSRVRYETTIELRGDGLGLRPFVVQEAAILIRKKDDRWMDRFAKDLRPQLGAYSSRSPQLLRTIGAEAGQPWFQIFPGFLGKPRQVPASKAEATVLSSLTTVYEYPLLFALKREMQSWRLLHLDPTALRSPDFYDGPDTLSADGAHLANTLRRIVVETGTEDRPDGLLNDLAADLAAVVPEVASVRLAEDDAHRLRQVEVVTRNEAPFSARVASDGTLRALALLAAAYDPRGGGLICFEEPENGIYPQRLARFVRLLRMLVQRSLDARRNDEGASLTQLILSSHHPATLRALGPSSDGPLREDVVFLDNITRLTPGSPRSRVTWLRRIASGGHAGPPPNDVSVLPEAEIRDFEVSEALDD
ncbi:MAG TPA: AAA family ATPase [Micromonosporaceae bacterium]|nr:AAA family ATPase [Micromonosporaceae bacterium]